jgi:pimeloyl-ACP methyl ester carboxylesterase
VTDHVFTASDGVSIAWRSIGKGQPVLMIHGFMSSAKGNWIDTGIAAAAADVGRQVILPDLRGHGHSGRPTDPSFFPADRLALDMEELAASFGPGPIDLCGYSLGARLSVRMIARGARPQTLVLGGMGSSGVLDPLPRQLQFTDAIHNRGEEEGTRLSRVVEKMLSREGIAPETAAGVLSTQVPTAESALRQYEGRVEVICGEDDFDNGDATGLAALFPNAKRTTTPGNHMTAVSEPTFRDAIARSLA